MKKNDPRGPEASGSQTAESNNRALAAALILTFSILVVFVGLIWLSALRSSVDGVTTSSGARNALVTLSACFSLALIVRSLNVRVPSWLPWVGVVITTIFVAVAGSLFQTGNRDTAFALYGGFQVPRSGRLFSDTHWILSWFSCDFCEQWDPVYGPGLVVLEPLTASRIGVSWLPILGFLLFLLATLALLFIAKSSESLGLWVLAFAAASPAWLLLVERANWDILVIAVLVIGAVVVARRPTYGTWAAFAVSIWILGTIKTYPFALGVVLLVCLGLRFGWVIVTGFLAATAVFAAVFFDSLWRAGDLYSSPEMLPYVPGSSPAYGRVLLSEQLTGIAGGSVALAIATILLITILAFAGWWGWLARGSEVCQPVHQRLAILSLAGATAFLAKALVVGFGFAYAGAALLLVVPAVTLRSGQRSLRNGSMVAIAALVLVAIFGSYNVVLGTLAGFVVSGFGLGFGFRVVWGIVQDRLKAHESDINGTPG